ncbi:MULTISPECIES: hypothetical protein [unclassified Leptolyngbya]|uniref:hypothetical protein n=1 Tax=unclassified Leptolyngbya TaxID=2650499 RepID=UPI001AC8C499|nr:MULTISPECIES: hypothetical protein [unclassified Leptolyngbya]MBN8564079.1 hypothetical protein [Leptolyngbya sp. UWPOB_LEPTO1]MCY6492288.1 hypothetical protein [Leptolyngbya sp. GGD]
MSFFVVSALTCFATYIAKVAQEEMVGIFAAIVAILSFVMSLVLAPWLVQASMLIFVVVAWRHLPIR